MTYSEKLKDPRWQKKRLEILERDKWTCQWCGDTQATLHVHHECYEKGEEPWDTWSELLTTVCETCHKVQHEMTTPVQKFLFESLRIRMKDGGEDISLLNKSILGIINGGIY